MPHVTEIPPRANPVDLAPENTLEMAHIRTEVTERAKQVITPEQVLPVAQVAVKASAELHQAA